MKPRSKEHRETLSRVLCQGYSEGREANRGKLGKKDSEQTREKKRLAAVNRSPPSQATKDKIGQASQGRRKSFETVEKHRASYTRAIEANGGGFATGSRDQDFKDKMSQIAKSRSEDEWRPKVEAMWEARRNQEITDEMRETYRQARLKVMRDNPASVGIKVWFDTKPELEFEEKLKSLDLEYKKQHHTSDPHYLYDFLVERKILIEIDGPWHYKASIHKTPELFEKMKLKDASKNMAAGKFGFKIARIEVGQKLPEDWFEILLIQGVDLNNL